MVQLHEKVAVLADYISRRGVIVPPEVFKPRVVFVDPTARYFLILLIDHPLPCVVILVREKNHNGILFLLLILFMSINDLLIEPYGPLIIAKWRMSFLQLYFELIQIFRYSVRNHRFFLSVSLSPVHPNLRPWTKKV